MCSRAGSAPPLRSSPPPRAARSPSSACTTAPAAHPGWIVVDVDESPDDGVVFDHAMREARLRGRPLRVVSCRRPARDGDRGHQSTADGSRQVFAQQARRLQNWNRWYPDVGVEFAGLCGGIVDYLAENRQDVQLVVVSAGNHDDVKQL